MSVEFTNYRKTIDKKAVTVTEENIYDLAEHFGAFRKVHVSVDKTRCLLIGGASFRPGDIIDDEGCHLDDQFDPVEEEGGETELQVEFQETSTSSASITVSHQEFERITGSEFSVELVRERPEYLDSYITATGMILDRQQLAVTDLEVVGVEMS